MFAKAYELARKEAARETKLSLKTFPELPPYSVEQTLDADFLPQ